MMTVKRIIGNRFWMALVLILILGAGLRFYRIGGQAFDRDEFFELNSSYGYFKTGNFLAWDFGHEKPFPMETQDDTSNERAEVFRWQLAQLYRFAEPSEGLARGLGATWGVLSIILAYLVAVSMTGSRSIGLIAAFLTAVGYTEVLYSRRLRMYAMLFPAYLFFSWTVFRFYESKYSGRNRIFHWISDRTGFNPAYLLPVIVAGLVSYNVHLLSVHIVLAIGAYALLFGAPLIGAGWKKGIDWKRFIWNKYILTVLAGLMVPLIYALPVLDNLHGTVRKNFRFILSRPNYDFFWQYLSDFRWDWIGIFLAVFGVYYLARRLDRTKESAFLFLSMAVPLAMAIFTWRRDVSHRYIYFLHPFLIILAATGAYGAIRIITDRLKRAGHKWIVSAAALVLLVGGLNLEYVTSAKSDIYSQSSYYPDFAPVFDYVMRQRQSGDVMITRAYRSFYWRGEDIRVFDTKSLITGSTGCEGRIDQIVRDYPSGWVVFPKVDSITVCSAGRKYYKERLRKVEDASFPSSVEVYRWQR